VTTTRPSTPHPPSRDGSVTASPPNEGTCWGCQQVLPDGRAGRRYCSARCRQAGWRRRHPTDPAPTTTRAPKTRSRREHTVYACDECGARYLAPTVVPRLHPARPPPGRRRRVRALQRTPHRRRTAHRRPRHLTPTPKSQRVLTHRRASAAASTCRSATPSGWPRPGWSAASALPATPTTASILLSLRRRSDPCYDRPRGCLGVDVSTVVAAALRPLVGRAVT